MELRALVSSLVMLAALTLEARGQEPSFLPGAKWGFVPPQGFTMVLDKLARFQHPSGALIVILDAPKPLAPEELGAIGSVQGTGRDVSRLDGVEDLELGGRPAVLVRMRLIQREADNFTLMIEGEHSVGVLTVAIPDKASGAVDRAAIRASLMTAVERVMEPEDRLAEFPIKLADLADMRIATVLMGSFLMLTDGPSDDMESGADQPFVVLMPIQGAPGDILNLDRDLPMMTALIKKEYPNAVIQSSSQRETANGPVLEIHFARPHHSGKTLAGLVWARMIGNTMLLMLVQYPQGEDVHLERFARIRDGAGLR